MVLKEERYVYTSYSISFTLQLHFNVRKMQQCGFVYLFLLLYPPFLVCKVFFVCVNMLASMSSFCYMCICVEVYVSP